jgi:hypothetical protein
MAKDKKSVVLYCDIIFTVEELNDEEAGRLFKHYLRYVNDLNPVAPDKLTQVVFEPIKQNLKRDLKKWDDTKNNRSIAGKAGAETRWQSHNKDGNRIKPMAKMAVNVNDNVNDINIYKFNFKSELLNYGFKENLIIDWLKIRKTKKATNTETAFKKFIKQVELTKLDKNDVLEKCVEKSWSGFEAEWIKGEIKEVDRNTYNSNLMG